ncbi:50S ribosomal protein L22 [candidate division TA06 bacterium]|nr:50S ribosomal protein L22 [candidate division TA06 bacterium]
MEKVEGRAIKRFVRISPRKARQVVDLIRGLGVQDALQRLQFIQKRATEPIEKTIHSAASNLISTAGVEELGMEDLVIKEARVDGGAMMKRWRARARGRAAPIRHRTSHITIVVEKKEG